MGLVGLPQDLSVMRGLKTTLGRATASLGWRLRTSRGKMRIRREAHWEGGSGK